MHRGERRPGLHWPGHVDAHLFAGQDVDRRLGALRKPFVHLHTQYNRDIPWAEIDMDFMNLNQSAHGDREFGFIGTRMGKARKVVVEHWQDPDVVAQLDTWARAAAMATGRGPALRASATTCARWR